MVACLWFPATRKYLGPIKWHSKMQAVSVDTVRVPVREARGGSTIRHPVLVALVSLELVLLAVQFVLGMFVSLYVTLPSTGFGMYGMMQLMFQPGMGALMAHMMTGMVLGAVAVLTFGASVLSRNGLLIAGTGGALAAVVAAGVSGMEFLFSGENNAFSYGMSLGFLLAFTLAFLSLVFAFSRAR